MLTGARDSGHLHQPTRGGLSDAVGCAQLRAALDPKVGDVLDLKSHARDAMICSRYRARLAVPDLKRVLASQVKMHEWE